MRDYRDLLLGMSRRNKRLLLLVADVAIIWLALWLSFLVRLGIVDIFGPIFRHWGIFVVAPLISIPVFVSLGMYRAVLRYFGNDALIAICKAVSLSALLLGFFVYLFNANLSNVPRSIVFNYWWLSLVLIGGIRLILRQYFMGDWFTGGKALSFIGRDEGGVKVAIYGAGSAGNQLAVALRMGRAMRPIAFIDDDKGIADRVICGLRVYKPSDIERMISETGAQEILLAIPSVSRSRRKEVLLFLEQYSLHVRTIPGFMDLASGRVKVDDLQDVDIVDLLGRDSVPPRRDLMDRCTRGRVVMVTGAGGSIGSELCRQLINCDPRIIILFDHSEYNLYSLQTEIEALILNNSYSVKVIPILGSIRDINRLSDVMITWGVDTVYHAAAYKHVPMVEHNIAEGILNNVRGSLNLAQAAIRAGVVSCVLISTDKAVRPTNIMGSTKRLAEMIMQALGGETAPTLLGDHADVHRVNKTRFTMVRFGNVLGSSGSVIPLFREQIKRGGPVTVTHPNITRYFMTIPEAAQLVIQAGSMGQGGDVFVLDMGQPVRIAELAERMVHLSGLTVRSERNPGGDISIEFSGLRPGEKLYEELLIGDNVSPTEHPMIMRANEEHLPWDDLKRVLSELFSAVESDDYVRVRQLLRETVNGYVPEEEIVDWIHQQRRIESSNSRH